jgi:hypothetical protein
MAAADVEPAGSLERLGFAGLVFRVAEHLKGTLQVLCRLVVGAQLDLSVGERDQRTRRAKVVADVVVDSDGLAVIAGR